MWTRRQLKERGKFTFKRNYWKCVLVALLLSVLVGGGGSAVSTAASGAADGYTGGTQQQAQDFSYSMDPYGSDEITDDVLEDFYSDLEGMEQEESVAGTVAVLAMIGVVVLVLAVAIAAGIVFTVFVVNPFAVGGARFFLRNLQNPTQVGNIGFAFDNNYKNVTKTMFFRALYTFLWSLLFIIPGIVKAYEYRMIPYLLADDPNMTKEQAFAESRRLMDGQKWKTFVLDLSFIGWYLLSGLTLGLLAVFYVAPYVQATDAALYEALRYGQPQFVQPPFEQPQSFQ